MTSRQSSSPLNDLRDPRPDLIAHSVREATGDKPRPYMQSIPCNAKPVLRFMSSRLTLLNLKKPALAKFLHCQPSGKANLDESNQ